jgi:RNA-directed DNA polymerase
LGPAPNQEILKNTIFNKSMGIKIKDQYATVCSPVNLYRAVKNALSKGLRFKQHGVGWKMGMEYPLWKLSEQLKDSTYKHGRYEVFKVYDPKERIILAAVITDRVVHHAIHDVIEPILERRLFHHSGT